MTDNGTGKDARWVALASIALWLLFVVVLIRTAWLSDDALITLRTVRNFLDGEGLRWNLVERVHTFSHPLWMLLLAGASSVTREFYLSTLALGAFTTLGALAVAQRSASSGFAFAATLAACLASSAFVDYSTAGLENPLTHLCVAGLVWLHTDRGRDRNAGEWRVLLGAVAGAAVLNRLDSALLFAPAIAGALWASRGASVSALRQLSLGFVPLVGWLLFSLVYFGFPFPNTAYAKLGAGIPRLELATQGLLYLRESLVHDPVTLVTIALAVGVSAVQRRLLPLTAGALLYVGYTIWIGGDFMSGRFLTAPFFLGTLALASSSAAPDRFRKPRGLACLVAILALGAMAREPRVLSGADFERQLRLDRVSDERSVYFQRFGWWSTQRAGKVDPCDDMVAFTGPVSVRGSIGRRGFCEVPEHHIIDRNALGDALLARLPARAKPELSWQPGHLTRGIPAGYRDSVETGENRIEDGELRAFYEELLEVTRGEKLLSAARLGSIWALNTGKYGGALSHPRFRLSPARSLREFVESGENSGAWRWRARGAEDGPEPPGHASFEVPRDGLELRLPRFVAAASLVLERSAGSIASIEFLADGLLVARLERAAANEGARIRVPSEARKAGFNVVRIWPGEVKLSNMHHLRLRPDRGGPAGLLMLDSVELRSTRP